MKTTGREFHALAIAALVLAGACGGGSSTPTGPSDGGSGGGGAQSGATITIGANGAVTPAQVTVNTGQTVTFVNNSNRTRNIHSDPHPAHTDCTQVSTVNQIGPGQTKATGAFTSARTCGFHDHDDPDNAGLKGSIVVR